MCWIGGYAFIHPPCCSCVDDVFSEEVAATERASKRRPWMMLFVTDSGEKQQKTSHTERHNYDSAWIIGKSSESCRPMVRQFREIKLTKKRFIPTFVTLL